MGVLVGETGEVWSFEIIPEMAQMAQKNVSQYPLKQVHVIEGDAEVPRRVDAGQ